MKLFDDVSKRIGGTKKAGFLWGGMVLIAVVVIAMLYAYQQNIDNGEGIFYTMFPGVMENVYVDPFHPLPFIIFLIASLIVFFFNVTTLNSTKLIEDGKGKAFVSTLIPNVLLFLLFWGCCWLFDALHFSEGLFICYEEYLNFLTIIVGAVMAVANIAIFAVSKICGNRI